MEVISGVLAKLDSPMISKKRCRLYDDDYESLTKKLCKLDDSNSDVSFGYGFDVLGSEQCSIFAADLEGEGEGEYRVFTTDPTYSLCRYLCECALDWYYTKKYDLYEEVNVVSVFRTNLDAEKIQTHNLHIVFKACLPDDKTTQTFRTTILFRVRRSTQIVIAYVGPDCLTRENFFDFPIDHLSDSDDDEDYGSDCEVSQLNPAFLKPIFKEKSPEKSPEEGPAYHPCPQLKYRRRRPGLYQPGTELSEEVERFKTEVANSGGFEVGYFPLMNKAGIHGTWICKYYDIVNKPLHATWLSELLHLSQLALCFYNMKEDTKFGNVKVLRAMKYVCGSLDYNITFEASLSDKDVKIFQTNVGTSFACPVKKITIVFVRIKPN